MTPPILGAVLTAGRGMVVGALVAAGIVAGSSAQAPAASASAAAGSDDGAEQSREYLVAMEPGAAPVSALRSHGLRGRQAKTFSGRAASGAAVELTPDEAEALRAEPGVAVVEPNIALSGQDEAAAAVRSDAPVAARRTAASWGLDRSDQAYLPLNGQYNPPGNGAGAHIYILDGNINTAQPEFAGRIGSGASFISAPTGGTCDEHGTHVAGIAASSIYGMANQATIHPVRVLDCNADGDAESVINGINWVIADRAANGYAAAVVNMSLSGDSNSDLVNNAVAVLVSNGFVVTISAGNHAVDACSVSPASEPTALTVGATNDKDAEATFSNYGPCVDLYAPGVDVVSTDYAATPGTALVNSGTSQSAPHVAGAAAVLWALNPQAQAADIQAMVMARASRNVLSFPTHPDSGSPNALLNVNDVAVLPTAPQEDPTEGSAGAAPPAKVEGLKVVKKTPSSIKLKYRGSAGAKKYKFWIKDKTVKPAKWRSRGSTTKAKYTIKKLDPGTRYRIKMVAKNSAGTSPKTFKTASTRD